MYSKTRSRLNEKDIRFITSSLGREADFLNASAVPADGQSSLTELLHRRELFERSMTTPPVFLDISPQLFFYVFVYQALDARNLADDDVVDYIAGVCVEFRSSNTLFHFTNMQEGKTVYLVDLLKLLGDVGQPEQYLLRRFIGDASLFLTGFFPDFLFQRAKKLGAPPISYYERVGRSQFETAAGESLAYDGESAPVLSLLAERFYDIRTAINVYNDSYLHLHDPRAILGRIERQAATLDDDQFTPPPDR